MTGIYIDKNGNWKVQVNLVLSIEVETDRNTWEPARSLYLTLVATAKTQMDDKNPFAKQFILTPKNVQLSQVKMMKGEEVMEME